jgi:hypothetical protein
MSDEAEESFLEGSLGNEEDEDEEKLWTARWISLEGGADEEEDEEEELDEDEMGSTSSSLS